MAPREFPQEVDSQDIADLRKSVQELTVALQDQNLLLQKFIATQSIICEQARSTLVNHEHLLMGHGDTPGLVTKVSGLTFQNKLIMAILGTVSTATFGITIYIITRSLKLGV